MASTNKQLNAAAVDRELNWLSQVIEWRMQLYFDSNQGQKEDTLPAPPDLNADQSDFADFISAGGLSIDQRLCLAMGLAPHFKPSLLDRFLIKNAAYDKRFTEFGGTRGINHNGFLPTAETVVFVLAGDDLTKRFELMERFESCSFFQGMEVISIGPPVEGDTFLSGKLGVEPAFVRFIVSGDKNVAAFDSALPLTRLNTNLSWEDLVLDQAVAEQLTEIADWIMYQDTVLKNWEMEAKLKPGLAALFCGPPGTGKTLTAALLGKQLGLEVYRVDLLLPPSGYIGETEKKLSRIFDLATSKKRILFFDVPEQMFIKSDSGQASNDWLIVYLLQKIEDFQGLVLMAVNSPDNLQDAFKRKFQTVVHFPMPGPAERLRLWQQAFSKHIVLKETDLKDIAQQYVLSGGDILNVVRYTLIQAAKRNSDEVLPDDLVKGITRNLAGK